MPIAIGSTNHSNGDPSTAAKKQFGIEEAKQIGETLSIYWEKFDIDQFIMGLNVELEHGTRKPATDVTHDDPIETGKIALAHLNEFPDYYTRLAVMEHEAELGIPLKSTSDQSDVVVHKTEPRRIVKHNNMKRARAGVYNSNEVITWKKKR